MGAVLGSVLIGIIALLLFQIIRQLATLNIEGKDYLKTTRIGEVNRCLQELEKTFGKPKPSFDMSSVAGLDFYTIEGINSVMLTIVNHYNRMLQDAGYLTTVKFTDEELHADKGRSKSSAWVNVGILENRSFDKTKHCVPISVNRKALEGSSIFWVVNMLAHEYAHIILYGIDNVYKSSEIMTDMLAIHAGFDEAYLKVNKVDISDKKRLGLSLLKSEISAQLDGESEYASRLEKLYVVFMTQPGRYLSQLEEFKKVLNKFGIKI